MFFKLFMKKSKELDKEIAKPKFLSNIFIVRQKIVDMKNNVFSVMIYDPDDLISKNILSLFNWAKFLHSEIMDWDNPFDFDKTFYSFTIKMEKGHYLNDLEIPYKSDSNLTLSFNLVY